MSVGCHITVRNVFLTAKATLPNDSGFNKKYIHSTIHIKSRLIIDKGIFKELKKGGLGQQFSMWGMPAPGCSLSVISGMQNQTSPQNKPKIRLILPFPGIGGVKI